MEAWCTIYGEIEAQLVGRLGRLASHATFSLVRFMATKQKRANGIFPFALLTNSADIAPLILTNYKKGISSAERVPKASSLTISGIVQDS